MTWEKAKYYLRGTIIIILIFAVVLVSCYGIAVNGDEQQRKIFYIIYFSVVGASLVAYWVYAFIREKKLREKEEAGPQIGPNAKKNNKGGQK
jgi:hypothetical protein